MLSASLVAIVTLAANDSFAGVIMHRPAQQLSSTGSRTDLVGLNPQPEPPSRPTSRVNLVGLNPQPEPPSRPVNLLNPQPEPPGQLRVNRLPGRGIIIQHRTLRPHPAPAGDQMSNIELQDRLQKQQQTLQTLGNVSKTMRDTSRSILRNLK
jgi:hypothetical protein